MEPRLKLSLPAMLKLKLSTRKGQLQLKGRGGLASRNLLEHVRLTAYLKARHEEEQELEQPKETPAPAGKEAAAGWSKLD